MRVFENQDRETGRILGRALLGNAAFSALTGLVLVTGAARIGEAVGLETWVLVVLGLGLLAYAIALVFVARSEAWILPGGRLAVAADAAWVAGAVALVVFTDALTPSGEAALLATTAVVAGFGVVQAVGVARFDTTRGVTVPSATGESGGGGI